MVLFKLLRVDERLLFRLLIVAKRFIYQLLNVAESILFQLLSITGSFHLSNVEYRREVFFSAAECHERLH